MAITIETISTTATAELLEFYNAHTDRKIKKFKDRATAEARVLKILEQTSTKEVSEDIVAEVNELTPKVFEHLSQDATIEEIRVRVNQLSDLANNSKGPTVKDIKSTRKMTEDDVERLTVGDLADEKHGSAAKILGLSYGQVYTARKGQTFKKKNKEIKSSKE